ncbi:hypothetical protein [Sphingomonas sp. KR3-1]|uniref:hypothetical protein n=1 Tax=Sphingomonas sp. KR3-1 TaxID=3156611 RepID=UPI0032B61BB5
MGDAAGFDDPSARSSSPFGQALLALKNAGHAAIIAGEPISSAPMFFLSMLTGTLAALSKAVLPFLGAVLINRWNRRNPE